MQVQMFSLSGQPNGVTEAYSVSKPGQHYTVYGATQEKKSEVSPQMQMMLDDHLNPDLQDYARRVLNK